MTREEVKEILPMLQAFANGKTLQYKSEDFDEWIDMPDDIRVGLLEPDKYRIKSEMF